MKLKLNIRYPILVSEAGFWLEFVIPYMENKEQYISLQEASKICEYSQEYLSLRARQGKLKAIKIGRNWVTKKEWLEDYLKNFNNKNGNHIANEKKQDIFLKPKDSSCFFKEKFSFPAIKQYPFLERKFSLPLVRHRPFSIKFAPTFPKNNLLVARINRILAGALITIFLTGGGFFVFREIGIKNYLQKNLAGISRDIYLVRTTMDLQDIQAANFQAFREYGEWLLMSAKNLPRNIAKAYWTADKFIEKKLKGAFWAMSGFFDSGGKIAQKDDDYFSDEAEKISTEKMNEAMVVLPHPGEQEEAELSRKIKNSFSDEVRVEVKDESSGVITPIFKGGKEGDKYFYVLLPLKD